MARSEKGLLRVSVERALRAGSDDGKFGQGNAATSAIRSTSWHDGLWRSLERPFLRVPLGQPRAATMPSLTCSRMQLTEREESRTTTNAAQMAIAAPPPGSVNRRATPAL